MKCVEYLTLSELRLKDGAKWSKPGSGLHFVFPLAGAGACGVGGLWRSIVAGDVLLLYGQREASICAANGQEFICLTFSLLLEQLFPLLGGREISLLHTLNQRFEGLTLYASHSSGPAYWHRVLQEVSLESGLEHRAQLLRVAAAVLNAEFQELNQHRPGNQFEKHIAELFRQLTVDQILGFSVDDLAARFHCGRRHLNRVFHQHFNMSVATLKMEIRLHKATSLLRNLDAKVIDVAADCGFNHLGLFNACFRKKFGVTPSEWRKNSGQSAKPGANLSADPRPASLTKQYTSPPVATSTTPPALPASAPEQPSEAARCDIKQPQPQALGAADSLKPLNLTALLKENPPRLAFRVSEGV